MLFCMPATSGRTETVIESSSSSVIVMPGIILFEVRPQYLDHLLDVLLALADRNIRGYVLPQMARQNFAHQAVDRSADGGNLLKDRRTGAFLCQGSLERFDLALDTAYASQKPFLVLDGIRHGGLCQEVYWGTVYSESRLRHWAVAVVGEAGVLGVERVDHETHLLGMIEAFPFNLPCRRALTIARVLESRATRQLRLLAYVFCRIYPYRRQV